MPRWCRHNVVSLLSRVLAGLGLFAMSLALAQIAARRWASDLIVLNATIRTMDTNQPLAEALAISGNLPAAVLPALNARLNHPLELQLKRPLLRDYPNIAGLHILLRVMEVAHAEDGRVRVNESRLAFWSGLNSVERYFALLESWLLYAQVYS